MPNTEVENNETNNDNSSNPGVIDEETTISALQGHERVVTDAVKETRLQLLLLQWRKKKLNKLLP